MGLLGTGNPFGSCNPTLDLCCYQKSLPCWPLLCWARPGKGWEWIGLRMEVLTEIKEGPVPVPLRGSLRRVSERIGEMRARWPVRRMAVRSGEGQLGSLPWSPCSAEAFQGCTWKVWVRLVPLMQGPQVADWPHLQPDPRGSVKTTGQVWAVGSDRRGFRFWLCSLESDTDRLSLHFLICKVGQ